jgi:hypothetical protein
MCSDMASRGVWDAWRGSSRGTGQGCSSAEPFRPGRSLTLGTSEGGRRGGFPASSPKLRWSQRVSAAALVKSSGPPPEPPPGVLGAPGPPRSTGVAVAFTLELPRRFSRDSSGLGRPIEGPIVGECDARWRGRRDADSKPRRRAPRATDSGAGCLPTVGSKRKELAVEVVAECTARFHLVDVSSSLTGEASASGAARGRPIQGGDAMKNVTAMKRRTSRPRSSNPAQIVRRGEMRCRKRLLCVSCQTRPCHARGDGASSPSCSA